MNRISGLVYFSLGIYVLWQERDLSIGRLSLPGPGFFPAVICIALMILSLFLIISGGKKEHTGQPFSARSASRWLIALAALLTFFFFFEYLGFLVAGFLLMIILFLVAGCERWYIAGMYAFISIGLTYLLFGTFLKVNFPRGLWGF